LVPPPPPPQKKKKKTPPPPTIRPAVAKTADDAAATALPGSAARSKNAGSGGDWSSPGLASRPEDDAGSSAAFSVAADGTRVQELAVGDAAKGRAAQSGDRLLIDYVLRRANGYFIYSTVEGVSFQPADVPVGPVEVVLVREEEERGGEKVSSSPSFLLLLLLLFLAAHRTSIPLFLSPSSSSSLFSPFKTNHQGTGDLVPGLDSALAGALPGSKRRAFVPPSAGYTSKLKRGVKGALGPQPPTFASRRQLANHEREPLVFEVQVLRVSQGEK